MTIEILQQNLEDAKNILKQIPGKLCIISIRYESEGIVNAVIELIEGNSVNDVNNINEITIIKSIKNSVFNIKINV